MRKNMIWAGAVVAAAALSAAGVTGASVSAATTRAPGALTVPAARAPAAAVPGTELWTARYDFDFEPDQATSVAVGPGGKTVFVTGFSHSPATGNDYATVAYDAATGAQRWAKRYNGPASGYDDAASVAVSPAGGTVFVTGSSHGTTGVDYATVAYNAATGAQKWAKRSNGFASGGAVSVAVSPAGGTVFVTGSSQETPGDDDYTTVAYNAATGAQKWAKRYNGPANGFDIAASVAVSPAGGMVFVTGYSQPNGTTNDNYATVAYNAATGAQKWAKRYSGPGSGRDDAASVAVSPTGKTVFVTGYSEGTTATGYDYATVAYNASTGAQKWARRYNGPTTGSDAATSVAVSPNGGTVFVTGGSDGTTTLSDYATVAYNTATGAQKWVKRYDGGSNDGAASVAVSPTGAKVYVTGISWVGDYAVEYATVAYNALTGGPAWISRHGDGSFNYFAYSLAVSPTNGEVFVTGYRKYVSPSDENPDYFTVAYRG